MRSPWLATLAVACGVGAGSDDSSAVPGGSPADYLGVWRISDQRIVEMGCPYFNTDFVRDDHFDGTNLVFHVAPRADRETLTGMECEVLDDGEALLCNTEYITLFWFRADPPMIHWGRVRQFNTDERESITVPCQRIQTDEHHLVLSQDRRTLTETVTTDMQAVGDRCDEATAELQARSGLDYPLDGCSLTWQVVYSRVER